MIHLYRRQFVTGAAAFFSLVPGLGSAFGQSADSKDETKGETQDTAAATPLKDMVLGKDDAPVTVIEYASATCPHCAEFHKHTFPAVKKDYIDTGKVKFIFREFPGNDLALAAFMLARCAPEDKYFPMISMLFERQDSWAVPQGARDELFKIAQLAGFNRESFEACLKNEKIAKGILAILDVGRKEFGVKSTPTLFINGEELQGDQGVEKVRKMIDGALQ